MGNTASRDDNFVPTMIGILNSDGKTIIPIQANPVRHSLKISDGTTGTDKGPVVAGRDGNFVYTLLAASSSDGKTPIPMYADSSGSLLIKST